MAFQDINAVDFEDYFPSMITRLGTEGFIWELCNGFRLLMDVEKGLITFESLKKNSVLLGLHDLRDEELMCMLMEGDLDGDGALSQTEFCILMFRLSPGLNVDTGLSKLWTTTEDVDVIHASRKLGEEALRGNKGGFEAKLRKVEEALQNM